MLLHLLFRGVQCRLSKTYKIIRTKEHVQGVS